MKLDFASFLKFEARHEFKKIWTVSSLRTICATIIEGCIPACSFSKVGVKVKFSRIYASFYHYNYIVLNVSQYALLLDPSDLG